MSGRFEKPPNDNGNIGWRLGFSSERTLVHFVRSLCGARVKVAHPDTIIQPNLLVSLSASQPSPTPKNPQSTTRHQKTTHHHRTRTSAIDNCHLLLKPAGQAESTRAPLYPLSPYYQQKTHEHQDIRFGCCLCCATTVRRLFSRHLLCRLPAFHTFACMPN